MEELDIKELLTIFWKKKWLIIILTLAGIIGGYLYNATFVTPKYAASTTFVLVKGNGTNSSTETGATITTTDITLNQKLITTYAELIKSDNVLNKVISNLGLNITPQSIRKNTTVASVKDTEVIKLVVLSEDKENVSKIANEMVKVFSEQIKEIYNIENIHIVDAAKVDYTPQNKNPLKFALIGGIIGIIVSICIVLLINMLSDSVKDGADIEKKLGVKKLATFRKYKNTTQELSWNPKIEYAEGFKVLRTNLQFGKSNNRSIAISSLMPGEGKSWVTSNLAMAYAMAGNRVIIVDADMRKGVQHIKFSIKQKPGFSDFIKDTSGNNKETLDLEQYIRKTKYNNIFVIPCGTPTFDSSELLTSEKAKKAIRILEDNFDVVLLDSTPGCLVADAAVLSRLVSTNVIVVESEKTKLNQVEELIKQMKNIGGHIEGVVINKVNDGRSKKNYYYYYGNEDEY